jgi:hypothetical protein
MENELTFQNSVEKTNNEIYKIAQDVQSIREYNTKRSNSFEIVKDLLAKPEVKTTRKMKSKQTFKSKKSIK